MIQLIAEVDVDRLREAAAQARRSNGAAAYRAALALYGGELLPENRYDDWVDGPREELAELAQKLEQGMAALGPPDGTDPFVLPADASSFVGRRRELDELSALLPDARVITLAGTGGVGKTRMALELARRAAAAYPDGAALVELSSVTDPELVTDALAAALDVHALSGRDLRSRVSVDRTHVCQLPGRCRLGGELVRRGNLRPAGGAEADLRSHEPVPAQPQHRAGGRRLTPGIAIDMRAPGTGVRILHRIASLKRDEWRTDG